MRKFFNIICLLILILVIITCSTSDFHFKKDKYNYKGNRFAVIAGDESPLSVAVAARISESLREISKFSVLSSSDILNGIKDNLKPIRGPYKSAYFEEIDIDFSLTDVGYITKIQRKLGVDYIYVIWNPSNVEELKLSCTVKSYLIAQLFQGKDATEIANANYNIEYNKFGLVRKPIKDAIHNFAEKAARQIAESTGMIKE